MLGRDFQDEQDANWELTGCKQYHSDYNVRRNLKKIIKANATFCMHSRLRLFLFFGRGKRGVLKGIAFRPFHWYKTESCITSFFFLLWCYKVRVITFPHGLASTAGPKLRQKISFVVLYLRRPLDSRKRKRKRTMIWLKVKVFTHFLNAQSTRKPSLFFWFTRKVSTFKAWLIEGG